MSVPRALFRPGVPSRRATALAVVAILATTLAAPAAIAAGKPPQKPQEVLAAAREAIDGGRAQEALPLLDRLLAESPDSAPALLLRSTAHFMNGDMDDGRRDLERCLQLDPRNRQAWLNRGALAIADKAYDKALDAFLEAEKLDPAAVENDLNIGAVLLLQGKLAPASERFRSYLGHGQPSADSYYLVATNYALAGYAALAVENLKRAIDLDERSRLRARTDPNFEQIGGNPQFRELLAQDDFQPPPGAYRVTRSFEAPYDPQEGSFLGAVVDALQAAQISYDPRVEVTADWTVLWGELRIELSRADATHARVEVTAPADRMTPAQWQERVDALFKNLEARLPKTPAPPLGEGRSKQRGAG